MSMQWGTSEPAFSQKTQAKELAKTKAQAQALQTELAVLKATRHLEQRHEDEADQEREIADFHRMRKQQKLDRRNSAARYD
jgi:hypothetical protein